MNHYDHQSGLNQGGYERIVKPLKKIIVMLLKRDRCYNLCKIQRFTSVKKNQTKTVVYLNGGMGVIRTYG